MMAVAGGGEPFRLRFAIGFRAFLGHALLSATAGGEQHQ
jgi:hypothetical protein